MLDTALKQAVAKETQGTRKQNNFLVEEKNQKHQVLSKLVKIITRKKKKKKKKRKTTLSCRGFGSLEEAGTGPPSGKESWESTPNSGHLRVPARRKWKKGRLPRCR